MPLMSQNDTTQQNQNKSKTYYETILFYLLGLKIFDIHDLLGIFFTIFKTHNTQRLYFFLSFKILIEQYI